MYKDNEIWVASDGETKLCIKTNFANRHGLIAGATGTGKTVTLKVMAEMPEFRYFSQILREICQVCVSPAKKRRVLPREYLSSDLAQTLILRLILPVFGIFSAREGYLLERLYPSSDLCSYQNCLNLIRYRAIF